MIPQPTLTAERLILRPLSPIDAAAIQRYASDRAISDSMISLPHPYPVGTAAAYILKQRVEQQAGRAVAFAIERSTEPGLIGILELRDLEPDHAQAELSFWLAAEVWGRGYMSEALQLALRFGFEVLALNRIYAYHMVRNPGSGRVLQKNGLTQEGILRQRVRKAGMFEDVALWAILRADWLARSPTAPAAQT